MSERAPTGADPLFEERYRAMSSRDSRFDGQFIAGVHSTGIYCRPSCPAMTPRARNVRFYRTAAAAHEAGLRACKRCQPDAVPGSPDWNRRDDLAARAMRLIGDGVVEREGVAGLAARLGYASRHVTRVLVEELGAGPLALARANRAQNARVLLCSTELPVADVAFAAGFASIRQFNDTMQQIYESTPSAIRSGSRRTVRAPERDAAISLRLPARAPFDGAGVIRFLADHAILGVEEGDGERFERALRMPHGLARARFELDGPSAVRVTARLTDVADVATLVARARRLFDLDADSTAIDDALARDPALAPLVAQRPGIRLPGSVDPEETIVRTMIGQQISVSAARTVLGSASAGLSAEPGLVPTSTEIAEHGREVLRGPTKRVEAIVAAAEALASGRLRIDVGMSVEELRSALLALPGIGPWTAGYVAIRVLGATDVLLASDLVMLRSAAALGLPATASGLSGYAARWAPWRSYAGMHLWGARTMTP